MKDAITLKEQPQPTDDHMFKVLEKYILKYGGSRVFDEYFADVGDNKYEIEIDAVLNVTTSTTQKVGNAVVKSVASAEQKAAECC